MKKVLFVCSGNIDRSPTAEALLKGKEGVEARSAGTWSGAPKVVSKELIEWADVIFAMEEHHKESLKTIDPQAERKTIVLNINDSYLKGNPQLEKLLREKLSQYFNI